MLRLFAALHKAILIVYLQALVLPHTYKSGSRLTIVSL